MVQAARSGVQNIAEGSMASGTSKKSELKLTGVARASLEELLLDYQDFLRHRGLRPWPKDAPEAVAVRRRQVSDASDKSDPSDAPPPPACPLCARAMVRRTARRGPHAGQGFWGCPAYPECTGTRP